MASVEDYPFADFNKLGSFDHTMNAMPLGYPTNPDLMPLGFFDGMEQLNTNMAYLEEESSPLPISAAQQQLTLGAPSMILPHNTNYFLPVEHTMPQHQRPQFMHNSPLTYQPMEQEMYSEPQQQQSQLHHQQQFIPQPQFDGFPPVHAFVPAVSTPTQRVDMMEYQTPQRARIMSEPDLTETFQNLRDSPLSFSPESIIATSVAQSYSTAPSSTHEDTLSTESFKRYKVIRGISSGGSATKPPRVVTLSNHHYTPVNLEIVGATLHDLCLPQWSEMEKLDRRRIIRVERFQIGSRIVAQFSIVGAARENPKTSPAAPGVDVVEVSCLECYAGAGEDDEDVSDSEYAYKTNEHDMKRSFYITSVEVIKVVELLIGTELQDAVERRRERGRIRSNLVPFWSKKPISSRMSNQEGRSSPLGAESMDFRVELATRIMSYDSRKPRGFDKEVRILKWEKLVPALKRALQSYYVEIPDDFEDEA